MRANNTRGGAGVASGATIVAVKALDAGGYGYADDMARSAVPASWLDVERLAPVGLGSGLAQRD
jgi:hypothetical protein